MGQFARIVPFEEGEIALCFTLTQNKTWFKMNPDHFLMCREKAMAFNTPRTAKDAYTLDLWRQHGLGDNPSFEQIEPVAKRLLKSDPLDGAAMVLCRKVRSSETNIGRLLFGDTNRAFGLLLLQYDLENP